MRHSLPAAPQFYMTAPQECPYLEGKMESKIFAGLQGDNANDTNNILSKQGFRRSQNVIYRPACKNCCACFSARINLSKFKPTKSQLRAKKRNASLTRRARAAWASEDQYDLFSRYLDARHDDGGMADMDVFEFAAMVEETPVKTRVIEYYPENAVSVMSDEPNGALRAACLTDVLDDGLSMVYSFYDPELRGDSLGTFMVMDHIAIAKDVGLPYVYLGYWVPGSPKMAYKANFAGVEIYRGGRWQSLSEQDDFSYELENSNGGTLSDQIASIQFPSL